MNNFTIKIFGAIALSFFVLQGTLTAQRAVTVQNFSLPAEFGDETVALDSFQGKKAIVVVFTSYHCSWSVKYMDRLAQLNTEYADKGVAFIAINSNDPELEGEIVRIEAPAFPFLKDEDQAVAKAFGATKNPEAFVLVPHSGHYKVVYHGKIVDNPLDESMVRKNFLTDALTKVIAGEKVVTKETSTSGCSIKGLE